MIKHPQAGELGVATTHRPWKVLQSWLGMDRAATLVLYAWWRGAGWRDINVGTAQCGMARSAQAENPGRIVLIDRCGGGCYGASRRREPRRRP